MLGHSLGFYRGLSLVVWFHLIDEGAWRSRTVAGPGRCRRSWASCSPRGVMGGSGPGGAGGCLERGGGRAACRQTQLGEVRRGVLNVTVAHSALLEELAAFRKPALLAALADWTRRHDDPRHPVPGRRDRTAKSSRGPAAARLATVPAEAVKRRARAAGPLPSRGTGASRGRGNPPRPRAA